MAGLAELCEHHRDAAVILGAAARLRGAHDLTDPHIGALYTRTRTALGDTGFSTAYAAGRRRDVSAALARVDPARVRR